MQERIRLSFIVVVSFLLSLASGSSPIATAQPPAPTYTIIDLGTLGGPISIAYGINALGQVVGSSSTAAGLTHWFLWDSRTGIQDLGIPGGGADINTRGQVMGFGPLHASLWEAGTGVQDLGTLGGQFSDARGINAPGQVVGYSALRTAGYHAFLWEAGTGMQDLGDLGLPLSVAQGINDRGQVVGYTSTGAAATHAFVWEAGTGMQDLGTLFGESVAQGINDRGQVVGYAVAGAVTHAFLWEAGTGMQDLGTLGGHYSVALDINARGQVVGASTTAAGPRHAFLWEAGTGMQDLGTVGGPSSVAWGINARGQVVGWSGYETPAGPIRAILWEPTATAFAGTPGTPNCHGKSVSALVREFGGPEAAASTLGFPSVQALQEAIRAFCRR
jgi:probable HAF family extracellular repeat protein